MNLFKPKSPWEKAKKSLEKNTKKIVKQTKEITNVFSTKKSNHFDLQSLFGKPTKTPVQKLVESVVPSEPYDRIIENSAVFLSSSKTLAHTNGIKALEEREAVSKKLTSDHTYLEAALISNDVYDSESVVLQGGWRRSSEFGDIMKNSVQKEDNGLVSHLYSRVKNGKKEYIYAAGGTDLKNMQDILTDIIQLYHKAPQYEESLKIAKALKERIGRKGVLMFVGHSLGGGIATNNALHTGLKAIVFNPAGLSHATLDDLREPILEEIIDCVVLHNDILNLVQDTCQSLPEKNLIPPSIGVRILLHSKNRFSWESHKISSVIEAIEEYMNV